MQQLKNSYWFSHAALQSKAKVYYGDAYNLPAALGEFDIAVMGAVLLHCRDPLRIIEQCRKKSEITHHRRQVPSRPGRRAGMPPGADAAEFSVVYVVAFQHAILHPISGGDGFHHLRAGDAPAVSPRTSVHTFHYRRETRMMRCTTPELTVRSAFG